MPSKQVMALTQRIKDEFGIAIDPNTFRRTYAGHWLRAGGAFTWTINTINGLGCVGGFEPIKKYVTKKNKLSISCDGFNEFSLYAYTPNDVGYENIDKNPDRKLEEIRKSR